MVLPSLPGHHPLKKILHTDSSINLAFFLPLDLVVALRVAITGVVVLHVCQTNPDRRYFPVVEQ